MISKKKVKCDAAIVCWYTNSVRTAINFELDPFLTYMMLRYKNTQKK